MDFWGRQSTKQQKDPAGPPLKRLSTPAGQRLSVILENGDNPGKRNRDANRGALRKSALPAGFTDIPRESSEDQSASGYSYSVWSDGEKFPTLRNNKQIAKRGGWKRLLIFLALAVVLIVALVVGLVVGLRKKNSNRSQVSEASNPTSPTSTTPASPTTSISPTSLPSNFPVGTYSIVTFLDTVQTNCTSNPATWTCFPYTEYNSSPSKSLATFEWIVTSPSSGKYQVSSTDNPFSISFKNADMELLDKGKDSERWRFQINQTKRVSPSGKLTQGNDAVECAYDGTSLQASLYTKMVKSYPDASKGEPMASTSYPVWPFAARVEQAVGGGQNIPSCYKLSNGQHGDQITGFSAQDQSSLCSCLYKNWRTTSP